MTALTVEPPETAPYDRILYGAYEFIRSEGAASERFIAPVGAHHASVIEQRVAEALAQDADLKDLFVCNAPVPVGAWGVRPRVDLLCASTASSSNSTDPSTGLSPSSATIATGTTSC